MARARACDGAGVLNTLAGIFPSMSIPRLMVQSLSCLVGSTVPEVLTVAVEARFLSALPSSRNPQEL